MTIGIIGYGRFGELTAQMLAEYTDLEIKVFSRSHKSDQQKFFDFETVCRCDFVIPCVPISAFEKTIKQVANLLSPESTVVDVCSVKVWPRDVMLRYLPSDVNIIGTHPMFGPNSFRLGNKVSDSKVVMQNIRCEEKTYKRVKKLVTEIGLQVVELDAHVHDKMIAESQFLSLFLAHLLKRTDIKENPILTPSAKSMIYLEQVVGVDISLIRDIYRFNPYCKDVLKNLGKNFEDLVEEVGDGM